MFAALKVRAAEVTRLVTRKFDEAHDTFPIRLFRRTRDSDARDRVLTLAGQGFIAIVPLFIVIATFTTNSGASVVGDRLIEKFRLTRGTAEAVSALFDRPPSTTGGLTVFGVVVLLLTISSFARSMQRTYEAAWGLSRKGVRGSGDGLSGLVVLLLVLGGLGWIGHLASAVPVGPTVAIVIQLLISIPLWTLVIFLMLSRRVPTRRLLPGAVVSTFVEVIVGWASAIYVPQLIEHDAERYGVIGVAFALVSWLVVVSAMVVASAVAGAELGGAGPLTSGPGNRNDP